MPVALDASIDGDRDIASSAHVLEKTALRQNGDGRRRCDSAQPQRSNAGIVGAHFHCERPLSGSGQHLLKIKRCGNPVLIAEPVQSRARKNEGVHGSVAQLIQAGVNDCRGCP